MLRLTVLLASLWLAAPALADLRFCNQTNSNASVAIGYKDGDTWTSEGWWTVAPGDCTTPVAGDLKLRYYYYRITSPEIDFPTENYFFCTSPRVFTIVGDTECDARGYDRNPFSELDIGEALEWTVNLTASGSVMRDDDNQDALEAEYERQYRVVYDALQGYWQDAGDDAFGTRIDGNRLTDHYLNIIAGEGVWSLADTCDGANGAGPVLIVTYDDMPEEPLCWVIVSLNRDEFVFRAVGGNSDVRLLKQ